MKIKINKERLVNKGLKRKTKTNYKNVKKTVYEQK